MEVEQGYLTVHFASIFFILGVFICLYVCIFSFACWSVCVSHRTSPLSCTNKSTYELLLSERTKKEAVQQMSYTSVSNICYVNVDMYIISSLRELRVYWAHEYQLCVFILYVYMSVFSEKDCKHSSSYLS